MDFALGTEPLIGELREAAADFGEIEGWEGHPRQRFRRRRGGLRRTHRRRQRTRRRRGDALALAAAEQQHHAVEEGAGLVRAQDAGYGFFGLPDQIEQRVERAA